MLTLIAPPETEPISVEQAKEHLRVTHDDENALIQQCVVASREHIERETLRQLLPATWELQLDRFPCANWLEIPRPPLRSIVSVTYIDPDGTLQTWSASNYRVIAPAGPTAMHGRLVCGYGQSWPAIRCEQNAVQVRFIAGYEDVGAVPSSLKIAMFQLVGHAFEHREAVTDGTMTEVPLTIDHFVHPYRTWPVQQVA